LITSLSLKKTGVEDKVTIEEGDDDQLGKNVAG